MDTEFRDLDQIQERDDDTTLRRLSLIAMGAFAVVAVIFATGVVVVQGVDREPNPDYDPLEQLLEAGEFADRGASSESKAEASAPDIAREALLFPEVLREQEGRAEVEAAMASAAAEADHPDPVVEVDSLPAATPPPTPATQGLAAEVASGKADAPTASVTPSKKASAQKATTPSPSSGGRYGLQVISYTQADQANRYAEVLKERGHQAYVLSHTEPGKGTYWRVRIGPFNDQAEAEAYRQRFEREEQLKTLVVHNAE